MLAAKNRLTVAQFNQIPLKGLNLQSDYFLVKIKNKNDLDNPRFVIIAPKFLDKRSVYRNKAKRMIQEIIRPIIPQIKKPVAVLIKLRKLFADKSKQIAAKELDNLFTQARIL